jgi:hypothetical protein
MAAGRRKPFVSYRGMTHVPNDKRSKAGVDFVAEYLPSMPATWSTPLTVGEVVTLLQAADVIPMTSPTKEKA